MNKKCLECGQVIPEKRKFCSRKCFHIFRGREQKGKPFPLPKDRIILSCDNCKKQIERLPSALQDRNFCDRNCYKEFYGPIWSAKNRERNKSLWETPAQRKRKATLQGADYQNYRKREQKIVAEKMLGRKLKKGEVVHHKNGDVRDNRPENLEVLPSKGAHSALHHLIRKGLI